MTQFPSPTEYPSPPQHPAPLVYPVAGPGPYLMPEAPRSKMKTFLILLGVAGFLVSALVAVGVVIVLQENDQLQEFLASDAQIGQCYTVEVEPITCDAPHIYEVFGRIERPGDSQYPGLFDRALGSEQCEAVFQAYVGEDYLSAPYFIYSVFPTRDRWALGQRWEICVLSDNESRPIAGSAQR